MKRVEKLDEALKVESEKGEKPVKQFHELSETEREELRERMWKRAVRQGRELLWDVRCVYEGE